MFATARRWLTMTLQRFQGIPKLTETIVSQVISGRLRFAQYVDPKEGETPAMRNSYRTLAKEPTVKCNLDTLVGGVAAGEIDVPPTDKSPRAAEVAEFCKDLIANCRDGIIGIAQAIIGNGMIEGYVVAEPKWEVEKFGRWKGKIVLDQLKPKPTDDYWFEVDKFWNVTGIVSRFNQEVYPTSDFVYWRHHGGYTNNPHGTSLLRAVYRSAWMLDTVWKLRGIGLERYTLPVIIAKYPMNNDPVKIAMEAAVKRLKATGYGMIPQEAAVEPLQMAQRGTADFEAAVKDLKEDICIGMVGGSLQTLQGYTPGGRGSSKEHAGIVDNRVWMYANQLCEVIYRQILTPAVHWNYGTDTPVPKPVLGGLNDDEIKKSLDLDEQLQRMGYPVSISGVSERVRRSPATTPEDTLKAPQAAQPGSGGLGGLFGGPGGDNGPPSQPSGGTPPPKPPVPAIDPSKPPEPSTPKEDFSDKRNSPAVVIINQGQPQTFSGQAYRQFSAQDWTGPQTGPHGGVYWTNNRSGVKVYQRENPGGSDDHEQTHDHEGNTTAAGNPNVRVDRPPGHAQSSATGTDQAGNTGGQAVASNTPPIATDTPARQRLRPVPEDWATPVIPGQPVRPDAQGNPTWNQATSTGLPRARPIIDEIRRLFRAPDNITAEDVERVRGMIANTRGRDALYTLSVATGTAGSMNAGVVAGNVAQAIRPGSAAGTPTPAPTPRPRRTPPPPEVQPAGNKLVVTTRAANNFTPAQHKAIAENMKAFIPDWDTRTQGITPGQALLTMVGAPNDVKGHHVTIETGNANSPGVRIRIYGDGVAMTRHIGKDSAGPYIKNDYFELSGDKKGGGTGLDCFNRQVEAARQLGFTRIKTHAAGDYSSARSGDFNGYYTWPLFGYDMPLAGVQSSIKQKAEEKFPGVRTVRDIFDKPGGADWWLVNGGNLFTAEFDLKDNSRSMQALAGYKAVTAEKAAQRKAVLDNATLEPGKAKHAGQEYDVVKNREGVIELRKTGSSDVKAFAYVKSTNPAYARLKAVAKDASPPPPPSSSNPQPQPSSRSSIGSHQDEHVLNVGDLTMSEDRLNDMSQTDASNWRARVAMAAIQGHIQAPQPGDKFMFNGAPATVVSVERTGAGPVARWKVQGDANERSYTLGMPALIANGLRPRVLRPGDLRGSPTNQADINAYRYRISDAMTSGELQPQVGDLVGAGVKIVDVNRSGPHGRPRFAISRNGGRPETGIAPSALVERGWRPRAS